MGHRRGDGERRRRGRRLGGNVERVARALFTDFLWPFEVTAVLLVVAVVGGVVLARRSGLPAGSPDADDEADASDGRRRGGDGMTLGAFTVTDTYFLLVAAMLFTIGAVGLLVRRNVLVMFMCVELMLNAVNLTFVTFAKTLDDIRGQAIVFFMLVVAAAEVAVGLGDHRGHLPAPAATRPPTTSTLLRG